MAGRYLAYNISKQQFIIMWLLYKPMENLQSESHLQMLDCCKDFADERSGQPQIYSSLFQTAPAAMFQGIAGHGHRYKGLDIKDLKHGMDTDM